MTYAIDPSAGPWGVKGARPMVAVEHEYANGHCHDGEKCNAETWCECPCKRCMSVKRGEFQTR